jgi:predicted nucleic acid-binding protein
MPKVIADTSPIQYLYQIGLLGVLNVLYDQIIIPEAVAAELKVGREGGISLPDVSSIDWITDTARSARYSLSAASRP